MYFQKKRYLFLLSLSIIFSGCATISSIERNYRSIDRSDGISREEAKIIAKNQIIQTNFKNDYRVIAPKVYDTSEFNNEPLRTESFVIDIITNSKLYKNGKFQYSDSWHVVFQPKFLNLFSVYYLVVIDKNSGQVRYANEENAIAALGQLVFSEFQSDVLQSAVVATRYYSENNHWPSNNQELQEYYEAKIAQQDQKQTSKINFESLQFDQTENKHLLISEKEDEEKDTTPLYEILPLDNDEFIVNYKKDINKQYYLLKITGDKITVNPYFQEEKDSSSLYTILDALRILLQSIQ